MECRAPVLALPIAVSSCNHHRLVLAPVERTQCHHQGALGATEKRRPREVEHPPRHPLVSTRTEAGTSGIIRACLAHANVSSSARFRDTPGAYPSSCDAFRLLIAA